MSNTCVMCLDDLIDDIQYTPCIHGFHGACLNEWAEIQKESGNILCPSCKTNINMMYTRRYPNLRTVQCDTPRNTQRDTLADTPRGSPSDTLDFIDSTISIESINALDLHDLIMQAADERPKKGSRHKKAVLDRHTDDEHPAKPGKKKTPVVIADDIQPAKPGKKKTPVVVDEDEEQPAKPGKKKTPVVIDEDEEQPAKPGKKKTPVVIDEDEEQPAKPGKKKIYATGKKKTPTSDEPADLGNDPGFIKKLNAAYRRQELQNIPNVHIYELVPEVSYAASGEYKNFIISNIQRIIDKLEAPRVMECDYMNFINRRILLLHWQALGFFLHHLGQSTARRAPRDIILWEFIRTTLHILVCQSPTQHHEYLKLHLLPIIRQALDQSQNIDQLAGAIHQLDVVDEHLRYS